MLEFIFLFILLAISVEATTELLVKSIIFAKFRERLILKGGLLKELISCGYCSSVWVAMLPALLLSGLQDWFHPLVAFPVMVLCLHRSSNFIHNFNDKWLDKFYSKKRGLKW